MAELVEGVTAALVRRNLQEIKQRVAAAAAKSGRSAEDVELLVATKYLPSEDLPVLAAAGVTLVGENRAQSLLARVKEYGELFTWDFIGQLQSRKVKQIVPCVRLIHSVASESALEQVVMHALPTTRVLLQVNVANDPAKAGFAPHQLPALLQRCGVLVDGLMTMPPLVGEPESNRQHFSALRELASENGLKQLSMGTSQDYEVAIEEGATVVRLGSVLFRS